MVVQICTNEGSGYINSTWAFAFAFSFRLLVLIVAFSLTKAQLHGKGTGCLPLRNSFVAAAFCKVDTLEHTKHHAQIGWKCRHAVSFASTFCTSLAPVLSNCAAKTLNILLSPKQQGFILFSASFPCPSFSETWIGDFNHQHETNAIAIACLNQAIRKRY